jgi:ribosomal protein L37AE/L43A
MYDDDLDLDPIDGVGFSEPGGRSALRAATKSNPRNRPCPSCGAKRTLTALDVARGYQCNRCADRAEGGGYGRGDY